MDDRLLVPVWSTSHSQSNDSLVNALTGPNHSHLDYIKQQTGVGASVIRATAAEIAGGSAPLSLCLVGNTHRLADARTLCEGLIKSTTSNNGGQSAHGHQPQPQHYGTTKSPHPLEFNHSYMHHYSSHPTPRNSHEQGWGHHRRLQSQSYAHPRPHQPSHRSSGQSQGIIGPSLPWTIPTIELNEKTKARLATPKPPQIERKVNFVKAKQQAPEPTIDFGCKSIENAAVAVDDVKHEAVVPDPCLPSKNQSDNQLTEVQRSPSPEMIDFEALAQRENKLNTDLIEYHDQVSQMEALLQGLPEPEPDILGLVGELRSLISMSETELLEIKRKRLLGSVSGVSTDSKRRRNDQPLSTNRDHFAPGELANSSVVADMWDNASATEREAETTISAFDVSQNESKTGDAADESQNNHDDTAMRALSQKSSRCLSEGDTVVPETRCSAPFLNDWGGGWRYHNAIIHSVSDDGTCNVLFMCPRNRHMRPCPYFLKGHCRLSNDACRFSHGYSVETSRLKPFQEPDFGKLKIGGRLLVKYKDGIWYDAVLLEILEDSTKCRVRYVSYDVEAVVELDELLPEVNSSVDVVSSSDEEVEDNISAGDRLLDKDTDSLDTEEFAPFEIGGQDMADWEKHTRGFGSKLMAKMGYVRGHGLGSRGQGRVDIVPVKVLPPGKSLDYCVRKGGKMSGANAKTNNDSGGNVFQFLSHPSDDMSSRRSAQEKHSTKPKVSASALAKSKQDAKLALNLKTLECENRINQLDKMIEENISRARRNPGMKGQLQEEIDFFKEQRKALEIEAKKLAREQTRSKSNSINKSGKKKKPNIKKLGIF